MVDRSARESRRGARDTSRSSETSPRDVHVVLSGGLREAFAKLYESVNREGYFDSGNLLFLKEFAAFRETTLRQLLLELPQIAQQTEAHAAATGDTEARHALMKVIDELASEKGISVLSLEPKRGTSR